LDGRRILMPMSRDINCNTHINTAICCIWSTALYGAENWTPQKVDQKYLDSFEKWQKCRKCRKCRRMEIN
jgi:hypothetical protein